MGRWQVRRFSALKPSETEKLQIRFGGTYVARRLEHGCSKTLADVDDVVSHIDPGGDIV